MKKISAFFSGPFDAREGAEGIDRYISRGVHTRSLMRFHTIHKQRASNRANTLPLSNAVSGSPRSGRVSRVPPQKKDN